jgi:hypothetical protein
MKLAEKKYKDHAKSVFIAFDKSRFAVMYLVMTKLT